MRQGGARNVALQYVSAPYVMFLDADDLLTRNACKRAYEAITSTDSDLVQFNHIRRSGDMQRLIEDVTADEVFDISGAAREPFLNASTVTYGCWNKIYKTSLIRMADAKFCEHAVYEEPLFVYPCFLYADRVSLITDALYIYIMHEGQTVSSAIGTRLLDHPRVQLELLEYCINRQDLYLKYRNVIGLYFLWSYYCETLCFAGQQSAYLPLEYFKGMQEVCRTFFPDWRSNPFITRIPREVYEILETIDSDINTQSELNSLIARAVVSI